MSTLARRRRESAKLRSAVGVIEGLGTPWDSPTETPGGWIEEFAPGSLRPGRDALALRDHNELLLLGRMAAGTLEVEPDHPEGLAYAVALPDTAEGRTVAELVGRGDLAGSSVGMIVLEHSVTRPPGELPRRRILRALLLDVGPCTLPVFEATAQAGAALTTRSVSGTNAGLSPTPANLERFGGLIDADGGHNASGAATYEVRCHPGSVTLR